MEDSQPTTDTQEVQTQLSVKKKVYVVSLVAILLLTYLIFNFLQSGSGSPDVSNFVVEQGMSVREIATKAKIDGFVRSELLLYTALTYFHDPTNIHAGVYEFTGNETVFEVATKLAESDTQEKLIRITIPEGVRLTKIAEIAAGELESFDVDDYLIYTNEMEGYLFPETYFVPETFTAEDLADLQRDTFEENLSTLQGEIENSDLTIQEVIILASIVEREANDEDSMKMVSGILQNRLEIGMALQADATIEYVLATPLNELREGQLAASIRDTESPYNTYKNTGLTPTPIGNPGLMSIKAVLHPTESNNFYYLTDSDGNFHYAKTLAAHNQNIARYLR